MTRDFLVPHLRDLPYFRALVRSVEAAFYQGLDLPAPTLDVGCGDGHFASVTFDRPIEVGIDPWRASLREAQRRRAYRLVVQAEGGRMPFPDGFFASAFSNSVLEHIPHVEWVLQEVGRVLRPGAPFYFCVPNPRYLSELSLGRVLGGAYREWFRRVSRVHHAEEPPFWQKRLEAAGLELVRWWHYFSPGSLRMLEWGHYFGLPSLIVRLLTGRWLLVQARWNLSLTERLVRPYAVATPIEDGTFTFYIARRPAA
uniref:Methyltransferase type 11 n=1 Tax=uncultured Chloroflexota bacterium TaxID=166587 RepID=H5SQ43_9CHLR|nr:methyltransferase type 11 [uncultured Chloroflexota bacterium]